ncbi:coiled-coil domain-containing protein [Salisaeta longa]|uniref:hypothetical protein n=1 Tax=Salisaeta longa TaxID=503170 RepID=UPI0004213F34|nr:hypothetical protein [Salisaeta longa]
MSDSAPSAPPADWYPSRWERLQELLSVDTPEDVLPAVQALQEVSLADTADHIAATGLTDADHARAVLQRVHDKVKELTKERNQLHEALGVSTTDAALEEIYTLQAQVDELSDEIEALRAEGIGGGDQAVQMINSMEEQLEELYGDKEAEAQAPAPFESLSMENDTFEQLETLLAREERLQNELGVSSTDDVVDMVTNLVDQLEDVYTDRDETETDHDVPGLPGAQPAEEQSLDTERIERLQALMRREEELENVLGVSNPEQIISTVEQLSEQLDRLQATRERLGDYDLKNVDDIAQMIESMRGQLEAMYQDRERLSERGFKNFEEALLMIDNMQEQLDAVYKERRQMRAEGADTTAISARIDTLEQELQRVKREKEALEETRDALTAENNTYAEQVHAYQSVVGTEDPERFEALMQSMEDQLYDLYEEKRRRERPQAHTSAEPLVDEAACNRLPDTPIDEIDAWDTAAIALDGDGVIQYVNAAAQQLPFMIDPDPVGADFFFDVAPGANNALFYGRFRKGVAASALDTTFTYTYVSPRVAPTNLAVQLFRASNDVYWVFVRPL